VLIGIPFECMMEQVSDLDHGKANEVVRAHTVDDASIDKALNLIAAAKNPIALTEHVGGDPRAVERFVELCELFAIPVMESLSPGFMNFPRHSPALSAPRRESGGRRRFDSHGRRGNTVVSGEQDAEERQSNFHRR
jgi:thiamine pyrophosphate-dependent acetolactate synthase large subunit-like protein